MKRAVSMVGMFAMLLATLCLAAPTRASGNAAAKATTYTGWISDSNCGTKGMSASHKACTEKCVKMGAKYVFVDSKTKAVDKISNQKAITDADLGHEVTVKGYKTKTGMLHIDSVSQAAMSM